jgi:hypothetical protein
LSILAFPHIFFLYLLLLKKIASYLALPFPFANIPEKVFVFSAGKTEKCSKSVSFGEKEEPSETETENV